MAQQPACFGHFPVCKVQGFGKLLQEQRPSGRPEDGVLPALVCHLLGSPATPAEASGFEAGARSQKTSIFQVHPVCEIALVRCCHLGMDIQFILQVRKPSFRALSRLLCTWTDGTAKPGSEATAGTPETTAMCLGGTRCLHARRCVLSTGTVLAHGWQPDHCADGGVHRRMKESERAVRT